MFSLKKCLFRSSVHFWIQLFIFVLFFLLSCMSFLNVLEINHLLVTSFANIFSHFEDCIFVLFIYLFIYLFGRVRSSLLHGVFSLVAGNGGYSLIAFCGLPIAVASLIAEDGLQGAWALVIAAHRLSNCGSQGIEHRLSSCVSGFSCSATHGIFLDQGSNPCLLHWQVDFFFFFYQ